MSPLISTVAALAILVSVTSGLPAPQRAGADDDFVVVNAEQPREGRVLVSDIPLDHSSSDVASFRLPLAADVDDDVVVVEAGDYDEVASGRFAADIPRDRNFGIVAGPRLPLPEDDVVVVDVASDKEGRALDDIPRDHSATGQAGFRLPLSDAAGVRSLPEDDFEIVEVGDEDDSGRSIPVSLTPTNQAGFNQAAFRLPEGQLGDFVIIEAATGPQEPRVSSKDPSDCLKPLTKSRCRAALVRYYYNVDTGSCQEFSFGGCDSDDHSNRFDSLEECNQVCVQ